MDGRETRGRVLQERTNIFQPSNNSTFRQPTSAMEPHIQAMLTPLAARKAQLQRALSTVSPNTPQKPSGSAAVKGGERKPSHRVERDESPKGRSIKGTKNLDHGLPTNAFIVVDEAKETASGLPAPTSLGEKFSADIPRHPLLSQAVSPTSSRTIRYHEAEEALTAALRSSQHTRPTTDLQIDALRQATSVLNTRISDAADQLEKIRGLLANRGADPGVYQNMQRQRWMEERRKEAAEHLSKVLEQHLMALSSPPRPTLVQNPAIISNLRAKASSNLIAFFESSSSCQQISPRHRTRRRLPIPPRPRPPEKVDRLPRVHHHRQLLPLRLKVSDPKPLFLQSKPNSMTFTPPPSTSAQGPASTTTMSPATSSLPTPVIATSPLAPIQETPDSDDVEQISHPLPQYPTIPPNLSNDAGTATIWHSSPRSAADILSNFSVSVELPEYVGDLLSEFEANTSTSAGSSELRFLSELPHSDARGRSPRTLHKSSSLRRISALFSLGEGFSGVEGRGLSTRLRRRMSVLRQS